MRAERYRIGNGTLFKEKRFLKRSTLLSDQGRLRLLYADNISEHQNEIC